MSEDSNKPPSINLEELERQLREALSRRTAPTDAAHDGAGNEDPLSMLARLVEYEGAAKQANTQPVAQPATPVYAAPDPALPDPAYQQPAGWQPYEEQIPVDPAAGYQTHDHLSFRIGIEQAVVAADHLTTGRLVGLHGRHSYRPSAPWSSR